jgi:predicted enzyme related to lactoylglutathione lyase
MMSSFQKPGAVLFAKDLPRVAKFYEGVAGFLTVHTGAGLIVLESANQQLVLHGIPKAVAKTIVISSPPRRREDTAVKLIFPVASIAEARRQAVALGGELDPEKKEFEVRGFRACDGHDPEGNVVQFRESVL